MDRENLSNAFGWVSIACWIVVYSPQLIENYQLKSGEGLSVLFVVIWLLGDFCNLAGALTAGLQATVINLAIYYTLCDLTLLFQIYYYRYTHPVRLTRAMPTPGVVLSNENGEEAPLLGPRSPETTGQKAPRQDTHSYLKAALQYTALLAFVLTTGIVAWLISRHEETRSPEDPSRRPTDVIEWRSQAIGWASACLYLGSRIPQILKNFETKCAGLSLALFMFAIAGNLTYVLSICVKSMDRLHLIANASWLAGSGLTIFLDIFVLCQFFYFRASESGFVSETASRAESN